MKASTLKLTTIILFYSFFGCAQSKISIKKQFALAQKHYANALSINTDSSFIPRSTKKDGTLHKVKSHDWCSGFFAGSLWYLYEYTKLPKWKTAAEKWTNALEKEQFNTKTHDLGFMLWCSYGNGYRLTNNKAYVPIIVNGAKSLTSRFKPGASTIRSWDFGTWMHPVIIDNMMNLEFLFEATKISSNKNFEEVAIKHANHDMKHHFRSDYSSYHVVDYDTLTGQPRLKQTHQGASDSSAWARGQGWALYGFTTMYRFTKDEKYLKLAENIAHFILTHPNLPKDKVPYWDFDAPSIPNEERDASAAAIISSALFELSTYSNSKSKWYVKNAEDILRSLSTAAYTAKPGTNNNFILMHSVGAKPANLNFEVDSPLNYADYYYLEALLRYNKLLKKKPLF
jgi:unsaturated chondroitin disaccharide hydrolase